MTVLQVDDLSVTYGAARAVRGVSLELSAGEVVAIVGESGCGKSTLARALVGLEPYEGSVRAQGSALSRATREGRRRSAKAVQLVFQDAGAALDPRRTVATSLSEPLELLGVSAAERSARVAAVLASVELEPSLFGQRFPHELSQGQRQRVGLARGLISTPDVLVLDEPLSALDMSLQAQMLELLARLHRTTPTALLFISHDLSAVAALAQRIVVMYAGRFVEVGPTQAVLRAPRHPYTRALLEASTQLTALGGAAPSVTQELTGCAFAPRCVLAQSECRARVPSLEGQPHASACFVVK